MEMSSWFTQYITQSTGVQSAIGLVIFAGMVIGAAWKSIPLFVRPDQQSRYEFVFSVSVWLVLLVLVGVTLGAQWIY